MELKTDLKRARRIRVHGEEEMRAKAAAACAAAMLAGCATAPHDHDVHSTARINRPFDDVWTDVVSYVASHNIQIKSIAKDSGVIYADHSGFDDSVADCGSPGLFQVIGRMSTMNIFVRKIDEHSVDVTVNTTFAERRRFEYTINDINCTSLGYLEARVQEAARGQ